MTLNLQIFIGSTHPGRVGPAIASRVDAAACAHGAVKVELVDLDNLALPLLDESGRPGAGNYTHDHTKRWSAIVGAADALSS